MRHTIYCKKNLNSGYIQNLRADSDLQITDAALLGLQLRYYAKTKRKVFYLWYRVKGTGRQRNMKLGTSLEYTLGDVRAIAIKLKREIAEGHDPQILRRERSQKLAAEEQLRKKVKQLVPEFLERHSKVNNRETTYRSAVGYFKNHILPHIGDKFIGDMDRAAVQDLYDKVKNYSTHATGDHMMRILSSFLNWCEKYNYRTINTNPCRHVTNAKIPKFKPTILDAAGYGRLMRALDDAMMGDRFSPQAALAIKTLALTGCRCGEITDLEHTELDLDNGFLRLTKRKTDMLDVPLGAAAIDVIRKALSICKSKKYVFHSPINCDRPIRDLRKVFIWALNRAELPPMRIHDLRHSFATMATSIGEDIRTLKDVLGHTKITTTEIYAHTTGKAARQVANNTADAIMGTHIPATDANIKVDFSEKSV